MVIISAPNTFKMKYIILIFILLLAIIIFPFLPGEYDALSFPLSTSVQIFSGIGLLTCIPAALWFYHAIKHKKDVQNSAVLKKHKLYIKIYIWTSCFALSIVALFTMLGLSRLLGIFLFISLVFFIWFVLKKISHSNTSVFPSFYIPLRLTMLPVLLLVFQFLVDKPLTNKSRTKAINSSRELIDEIDRYKLKYGKYPLTLNAISKDYKTGVTGIEKYYYTYDDTTYNIYFEQPRFFFDQFGTREFVVYNPKDNHLMLSHASWHMLLEPGQFRQRQGWYTSFDTGIPHWRYFWFD